jgi:hypothetical protein
MVLIKGIGHPATLAQTVDQKDIMRETAQLLCCLRETSETAGMYRPGAIVGKLAKGMKARNLYYPN